MGRVLEASGCSLEELSSRTPIFACLARLRAYHGKGFLCGFGFKAGYLHRIILGLGARKRVSF